MATVNHALDGESQTTLIIAIAAVFGGLSTIVVGLRLYTRGSIIKLVGADDITIAVAQVFAIAVSIVTITEALHGLGQHTWMVEQDSVLTQVKCLYTVVLVYNAAQIILKVSFLIQYRRVFTGETTRKVCLILLVLIIIWGITQEVLLGLACIPISIIVPSMANKCITTLHVWYLTSSMNIVTDFIIFFVPLPAIIKLHMRSKQKAFLIGVFCLGFFACIISFIRISTLQKAVNTTDPSWDNAGAAYWTVIELNCGILCASLPTLRPLISRLLPNFLSSTGGTASATTKLGTMSKSRSRNVPSNGIYVVKEIELQVNSTTELRRGAEAHVEGRAGSIEDLESTGGSTHAVEVSTKE